MTPLRMCLDYLDSLGIRYQHISDLDTAGQKTSAEAKSDIIIAQTAVLKADSQYLLVVVPAESFIEIVKVNVAVNTGTLRFAREDERSAFFPFGDVGAVPPLGSLLGLPVYLDRAIAEQETFAFLACSRHDLIRMTTADFRRITHPSIGSFSWPDYQKEFRRRMLASSKGAGA